MDDVLEQEGLDAFRSEVRAFIEANHPGTKHHAGDRAPEPGLVPAIRDWSAQLYSAGYLGIDWPLEFGGRPGADPREEFIVAEELARARAWGAIGAGGLAAGALIECGTPEQQARYLPRIRNSADIWCQLFSEPGAGSDLASLRTRAVLDGDHYIVDGQKVWTTNGHHADIGFLLARTDVDAPKHKGITAFALDMRSPGIDVRPLREITGTTDFNEVFLEGVRIPADQIIGQVNDGWRVANLALAKERAAVARYGVELFRVVDDLIELMRPRGLDEDAGALRDLGRLAARVHVNEHMNKAAQSRLVAGASNPLDAPGGKIFFSEINLDIITHGLALQGESGILVEGDDESVANGWWQDAFLYARAYTIAGGANEVLRNVIAERVLGLPRES